MSLNQVLVYFGLPLLWIMLVVAWYEAREQFGNNLYLSNILKQFGKAALNVLLFPLRQLIEAISDSFAPSDTTLVRGQAASRYGYYRRTVKATVKYRNETWKKNEENVADLMVSPHHMNSTDEPFLDLLPYTEIKTVEMKARDFNIVPISRVDQPVYLDKETIWKWRVTPQKPGRYELIWAIHGQVQVKDQDAYEFEKEVTRWIRVQGDFKQEVQLYIGKNFNKISFAVLGAIGVFFSYLMDGVPGWLQSFISFLKELVK